jgi:hypothetical protein
VFKNSATIRGAINASRVEFKNSVQFDWGGEEVERLRARKTTPLYQRTAWRQCRNQPSDAQDKTSGC